MHLTLLISSLKSGGAERVLVELANYWVSKGHQVSLVTLDSPLARPFYALDSRIHLVQLDQTQEESSLFKRFRNTLKRLFYVRKTLKQLNPDRIISFVDVMNLLTLLASWRLNIPVVVSERTHPAYYSLPNFYKKLRNLLYPRASHVVVQTESAAAYFKKLKNVSIIPNGVMKPQKVKKTFPVSIKKIISVGRLCPFKGFDTLIHAFSFLLKTYPDLTLTIYGEGQERGNLENLINSLNLQEKVFLPGTTQKIQAALLEADLFVFPSQYEGFPNALCEAMAVGLPVIASNCSGNVDIIREGVDGRLFPVGDIQTLTALMKELLEDLPQRQRLSQNAQTLPVRFSPERIFALWDQLLI